MTIGRSYCIVIQVLRKHDAAVAQSVERRIGSAEVTGPIPVASLTGKKAVILDFSRVTAFFVMGFSLLSASEFLPTEKWRCAKQ